MSKGNLFGIPCITPSFFIYLEFSAREPEIEFAHLHFLSFFSLFCLKHLGLGTQDRILTPTFILFIFHFFFCFFTSLTPFRISLASLSLLIFQQPSYSEVSGSILYDLTYLKMIFKLQLLKLHSRTKSIWKFDYIFQSNFSTLYMFDWMTIRRAFRTF